VTCETMRCIPVAVDNASPERGVKLPDNPITDVEPSRLLNSAEDAVHRDVSLFLAQLRLSGEGGRKGRREGREGG